VATIYRKPKGGAVEDRLLTNDRLLGQAISLTSDGWFITTGSVVSGHRLSEFVLWLDGKSYTPTQGLLDGVNGTAYLKIEASGLTAPAFGQITDVGAGSEVWLERQPSLFSPSFVVSVSEGVAIDPLSSEVASRRLLVEGTMQASDAGSAVWNRTGSLIGMLESSEKGIRVIPSASIAASFVSLLRDQQIRHALLGVYAIDLTRWRIDGDRGGLPPQGAWIPPDRKFTKHSSITKDSPAAKAGLRIGDVILAVDRDILDGTADLGESLSEYRPGTTVTMRILRDGKEQDLPMSLGSFVSSEFIK
jgi:serine protease Do